MDRTGAICRCWLLLARRRRLAAGRPACLTLPRRLLLCLLLVLLVLLLLLGPGFLLPPCRIPPLRPLQHLLQQLLLQL